MVEAAAARAGVISRLCVWTTLGVAALVGAVGIARGTYAVGGSDSSCYGLMSAAFAQFDWQPRSALAPEAPWPDAPLTLAPAGFLPSPTRRDAASPVCAPGFSLVLAPFDWIAGRDGIFVATPIAGALLVWLTFVLGRQLAGPVAGVAGALMAASAPVLLFQVVQPMNDVLVASLWLAVLAAAAVPDPSRAWLMGALVGFAVLIRPNLAASAAVVGLWVAVVTFRRNGWSPTLARTLLAFVVAALPFGCVLLGLNAVLYGHPLQSGYGAVAELFARSNVPANVRNYGTALWDTQLGVPLIGLLAVVAAPRRHRGVVWLIVAISASVAAVYLFYRPFHEWWYLRFVLPGLIPLLALAAAVPVWIGERFTARQQVAGAVALALAVPLTVFQARVVAERRVFDLQRLERRFRTTGQVVRDRFPSDAVFITVWDSGTVRYHAGREAILWDALDPASLDAVISWLRARGLAPFLMLEDWEEPRFRERFGAASPLGQLDWPPRFEIERQVRIYSPSDRDTFSQGGRVTTEFVIPR